MLRGAHQYKRERESVTTSYSRGENDTSSPTTISRPAPRSSAAPPFPSLLGCLAAQVMRFPASQVPCRLSRYLRGWLACMATGARLRGWTGAHSPSRGHFGGVSLTGGGSQIAGPAHRWPGTLTLYATASLVCRVCIDGLPPRRPSLVERVWTLGRRKPESE